MSRTISNRVDNRTWGSQDQYQAPPWERSRRSPFWRIAGWFLFATYLHGIIDPRGPDLVGWSLNMLILGWLGRWLVRGVRDGRIPIWWLVRLAERAGWRLAILFVRFAPFALVHPIARRRAGRRPLPEAFASEADEARYEIECLGGGAYLGVGEDGEWVTATPQSATMVLGPPRSSKTSAVIIPAIISAPGPVISTATKPEVMRATMRARGEIGELWWFDPSGEQAEMPDGVRRLHWSPVAAATSWDRALLTANAMTACTRPGAGTTNESHWSERAAALLAPMIYAAQLTERPIEEVLRWTLRKDLGPALQALADSDATIAADVLIGIQRTDERERSSIFSATSGVLAAYNSDGARQTAATPNFDPDRFTQSADTVYVTSPEHRQALCAPLIVGMLEQTRHAVYDRAALATPGIQRMLWVLDEFANIAPIPDVLALASQAGGQMLDLMVCLQDLAQIASRYGQHVADAFLSMFQTKLLHSGIGDVRTLDAVSKLIGEYDRRLVSSSVGRHETEHWLSPHAENESVSYQTQRQRLITPADIAQLPDGHALLLRGATHRLIRLTRWYESEPWASIAGAPSALDRA